MLIKKTPLFPYDIQQSRSFIIDNVGSSWSCSCGSWINNYLWNQCLLPLKLWVRNPFTARCIRYKHYVIKFVSDLRQVGGFNRSTLVSSSNKTNHNDSIISYFLYSLDMDQYAALILIFPQLTWSRFMGLWCLTPL
jgi:hypothetical protein